VSSGPAPSPAEASSQQRANSGDSFVSVRLVLALMVVWGHSFPLGGFGVEPIGAFCRAQLSPDGLAVKGFFILSGFLLMQALTQRPCLARYTIRRVFRIMPAFWVSLALTSFVLVPVMIETMAPGRLTYLERLTLGDQNAITYFIDNAGLYIQQWNAAPVFASNAFRFALNGSLWTLAFEGLCYIGLALLAFAGITRSRRAVVAVFAALYVPVLVNAWYPLPGLASTSAWAVIFNTGLHPRGQGLMLAFAAGMMAHALMRGNVRWNARFFTAAAVVLVASMVFGHFKFVWPLLLPVCAAESLPQAAVPLVRQGGRFLIWRLSLCVPDSAMPLRVRSARAGAGVLLCRCGGAERRVRCLELVSRSSGRRSALVMRWCVFVSTSRARAAAAPAAPAPLVPGTVG
jgi:peptidoglycan/LPS O-acetylase OafA/YrhL